MSGYQRPEKELEKVQAPQARLKKVGRNAPGYMNHTAKSGFRRNQSMGKLEAPVFGSPIKAASPFKKAAREERKRGAVSPYTAATSSGLKR